MSGKPRLTARVLRGLDVIQAVASVELELGEDGYFADNVRTVPLADIERARDYLIELISWHRSRGAPDRVCQPCKRGKHAVWTCRGCGKHTCAHYCSSKQGNLATCQTCARLA